MRPTWEIAVLVLILLALAAQTALPAEEEPLARLPRWHFAPIAKPYFFAWWNAPAPSHENFARILPITNQTVECLANGADYQWWLNHGVWPSGWNWGTQGGSGLDSVEDFYNYLIGKVAAGEYAVCLDEWVGFDAESQKLTRTPEKEKYPGNPKNAMLAEACRRVKQQHPDFFIAAFTHMQSDALIKALRRGWVDLAIVESYPYVAGEPAWTPELAVWRLGNAKRAGVMEKTIPAFWISPEDETFTLPWLEKWIKTWREQFPQMPGLAPLFPGGHDSLDPRTQHLARGCDRLIQKYYLDPAPKIEVLSPSDGEIVTGPFLLRVRADKPVARWRLYIGAELVTRKLGGGRYEAEFPVLTLPPGPHVVTVQAITADWLRAAEQIEVEVSRPSTQQDEGKQ